MADFEFVSHKKEVLEALESAMERSGEAIGLQASGNAQLKLESDPRRIDTGLLRNSITYALDGESPALKTYHASFGSNRVLRGKRKGQRRSAKMKNAGDVGFGTYSGSVPKYSAGRAVYIGTNVEYAPNVHDGARGMAPNRFLRNAVSEHGDEYKRIIWRYMKGK